MIRRLNTSLLRIVALFSVVSIVCQAQSPSSLTRHVRDVTLNGQARSVGRLSPMQTMRLVLVLPLRNQAALEGFLKELYDPLEEALAAADDAPRVEQQTDEKCETCGKPITPARLEAKPAADLLYHLLAASLLLGEGQALRERSQDFRKLLVGALYVQRWLTPRDLHAPPFAARDIAWLDSLIAWTPIPKTALARP